MAAGSGPASAIEPDVEPVLHERSPFRPWRRARAVQAPVRKRGRDGPGHGGALERGRGHGRRGLAPRRLRGAPARGAHGPAARGARRHQAPDRRQQRRSRDRGPCRLGKRPDLSRAGDRRYLADPLPLPAAQLEPHEPRRPQPARPQPRPPRTAAPPGGRRGRLLGLPSDHPRPGPQSSRAPRPGSGIGDLFTGRSIAGSALAAVSGSPNVSVDRRADPRR